MTPRHARPRILSALPRPHGVLEASAGTGKTYTLERLVVDFLLDGTARLDEMLVVTFTEKAAAEIRARVRSMLERLRDGPHEAPGEGEPSWELDATARDRIVAALRGFDGASISTIHGFCRRVLSDTAFEAGRLFDQEAALSDDVFDEVFRRLLRERFAAVPAVAAHLETHGPERLRALLAELVKTHGAPLPDRRPLAELARDVSLGPDALAALDAALPRFATKQTLPKARKALEALGELVGDLRAARGSTEGLGERWVELRASLSTSKGAWNAAGEALFAAGRTLGDSFDELCFWLDAIAPSPDTAVRDACLEPLVAALRETKAARGLFDFDDMVKLVAEALEGDGGEALAARLRAQYRVALIDEFQDTDDLQWRIFERVFAVPERRLVVIGDPKQAIYGFRGGDLPTYLKAVRTLLGGREDPLALDENFRSTAAVIDAYNAVFAQEGFFTGDNRYPVPVRCGRRDLALLDAEGRELPPVVVPDVVFGADDKPSAARVRDRMARALISGIVDVIERGHLREKAANGALVTRKLGYSDVFVLVGKGSEGHLVASHLRRAGIPVAFFKQRGLFASREASDLLDVLRAIESPDDRSRFARAAQTIFFGYGVDDLEALAAAPDDHPVRERLRRLHRLASRHDLPGLLSTVLDDTDVRARLLLCEEGERRTTNVEHLVELLSAEARRTDLAGLVARLAGWIAGRTMPAGEDGDQQRLEGRTDAVQILTLHASKGLERAVVAVFAPGANPDRGEVRVVHDPRGRRRVGLGKLGPALEARRQEELEEERQRLAYVGLTRAKACLILPRVRRASPEGEPPKPHAFKGTYEAIHPFVHALVEQGLPGFAPHRPRGLATLDEGLTETRPRIAGPLALALPEPRTPEPLPVERLRAAARPVVTASFTSLSSLGDDAKHGDVDVPSARVGEDDLPRGRGTGVAIHRLLECVPLGPPGLDLEAFRARHDAFFRSELEASLLEPRHHERAVALVHAAVTAELPLEDGGTVALSACDPARVLREMEFLSPYLDSDDFLGGSIDVLYEHGGRVYVLDWKTNLLVGYGAAELEADVLAHYELQLRIYTLAAVRFLGITTEEEYEARFGGVCYVYLRGLPDGGIFHRRPTYEELDAFRADLAARREGLFHG